MLLDRNRGFWALMGLVLLLVFGCGAENTAPTVSPLSAETLEQSQTITLGDVDPDEPAKKIARFQPLAVYLAANLADFGIRKGQVVIARDIDGMGNHLREGTIDIYFDSPFPTLAAQALSGSEVVLRRWKGGLVDYWSRFIAKKGGGIASVEDFIRDSPDQTNFPGYSSFWDTVKYNPAFQGHQMRPDSLKFPVFI